MQCKDISSLVSTLQTDLPASVSPSTLYNALRQGDWFYVRQPLPEQMMTAIAKASRLDCHRAAELSGKLTKNYERDDDDQPAPPLHKMWSSMKRLGSQIQQQARSASTSTAAPSPQPQAPSTVPKAKQCPYHMYACNCLQ
eukprot:NODE_6127_length_529_cov_62.900000_g5368_i0.p1 GENE.NODE_6127_length_529_cov_62.900000_g5368_i0~~NODE_6127_length_529_cov_62.900000_g5368_i0.p1  ORF type:complete len:140 (+),score=33.93 NODE_6127_length_529_cov_62.900000_g5368_i0:48-467(+)